MKRMSAGDWIALLVIVVVVVACILGTPIAP